MLSRVHTFKGLFLRQPLNSGSGKDCRDYSMPKELMEMLVLFPLLKKPTIFNDFDHDDLRSWCRLLQEMCSR